MRPRLSEAEREWLLHRVRWVDCFRFDAEDYTLRSVRVDSRRLYTPRETTLYLQLIYGIETTAGVLREAVIAGDLDCHVLKTPAMVRRGRPSRLDRAALRFTLLQIERSDWLYTENMLRRIEIDQGVLEARRVHNELRHPGRPRHRFDSAPCIDAGSKH